MDDPKQSAPELAATAPLIGRSLPAGSKLDRYTIVEPLGSGGMGLVYRARDEKLDREVAIKILSPGYRMDEDARRRFQREALALARLSHPQIAAIYDAGESNGIDYIVMECVPGELLAAKLKTGPLSLKDATSILLQIAQALEGAHERGVVHRDLKPANVMVTPRGQVKVLDFGLARLLASITSDATVPLMETQGIVGTPLYMSPEQATGRQADARTDLWSLGVIYYESLSGRVPFKADSAVAVLRSIVDAPEPPISDLCPGLPSLAADICARALQKDPAARYQSAAEIVRDASELQLRLSVEGLPPVSTARQSRLVYAVIAALVVVLLAGTWFYQRSAKKHWAREVAIPQIAADLAARKPLAAFQLLEEAQKYLPSDPQLKQIADERAIAVSIDSSPSGAKVEIQDYLTPDAPWQTLGVTPLNNFRMTRGYLRWRVSKPGVGEMIVAPVPDSKVFFALDEWTKAPQGMVPVPADSWGEDVGFVGWVGPYKLPAYFVDRFEVTNRDYQQFVSAGGYENKDYWPDTFVKDGRTLSRSEAMQLFRDSSGRPGPSTWTAGHYPEGKADFPVSGVSWFEAAAYAKYAHKSLPVLAQWFQTAPSDLSPYAVPISNLSSNALAPVGTYKGVGPFGTYDMGGNIREWAANPVDNDLRFILGGSWKSPAYLYFDPEALSPYDRSDSNGFRCVRNLGPLPPGSDAPVKRSLRDFTNFKPASDEVFRAWKLLYAYPDIPLDAKEGGVVKETADWTEQKVSFETGYRGERMSAYLFLPKNVRPPYQTVLFFPSARVLFLPTSGDGRELGDIKFFDYIVQSGRAVMYPIYEDTYERRVNFYLPGGSQDIELTVDHYKDAARSLDYLATRKDIDSSKLAYLGVSMGSAEGVILTTLMQDRLKTAVFLDGGFFLDPPASGADQAEFAPRLKLPVLMVNGRYDFTFSVDKAQNPLFNLLGAPAADKSHVILESPHDVTEQRPQLVKAVLDWLDRYLGRVAE